MFLSQSHWHFLLFYKSRNLSSLLHAHVTAAVGAAAAHFGASQHPRILGKFLAALRAALANLRAAGANLGVHIGTEQHKIGARLADVCAVV